MFGLNKNKIVWTNYKKLIEEVLNMNKKDLKKIIVARDGLILSTDTLKPDDLLSTYYDFIVYYNLSDEIKKSIENCFDGIPTSENYFYNRCKIIDKNLEEAVYILNEDIFNLFNEIAPDGYYFGNIEGDGACFGFFKYEEED